MAVPTLTLAAVKAELGEEQRESIDGVIDNIDALALTGLSTLADTGELADILAVTEHIDWAAAHVLTVARHLDWEIVTHDQARWAAVRDVLPWPLELVVLSDE
ncbi:hypothetical protein [Nocardia sp. NPDC056100]|uniref:hypothetical protein n=1 Tax=Nocardia sp. NPDC056100 TaxID=3345712 RepID=UPI0035DCBAA7